LIISPGTNAAWTREGRARSLCRVHLADHVRKAPELTLVEGVLRDRQWRGITSRRTAVTVGASTGARKYFFL
jgi:hypothetical protein